MAEYRDELAPVFTRAGEASIGNHDVFPTHEMLPDTAYQIVHDETMLDGNARLNLEIGRASCRERVLTDV